MGFFNETEQERQYKELIRAIRSSDLEYDACDYLVNYVSDVKNNKRNNDFYDFDLLQGVILEVLTSGSITYNDVVELFKKVLYYVKFLLPQGKETQGFESIKREIINYYYKIIVLDKFSNELYSLFDNRLDYIQIMDIILSDQNLLDNFTKIVEFAVQMGKEIDDQGLLKREIISYLHLFGSILSDDEDYLNKRINENRMKYGVYPGINEKTLASISREVDKARGILTKLDVLEKKVDSYVEKVDAKTKSGIQLLTDTINDGKREIEITAGDSIKKMQEDLASSKEELQKELDSYLISLEDTMKINSDQVFNQILLDAKEKLEHIKLVAGNLSGTTTKELLRIQRETQKSLDTLKTYVESSPELQSSLKVAQDSEEVMKALLQFSEAQKEVNAAEAGIIVPGNRVVVP